LPIDISEFLPPRKAADPLDRPADPKLVAQLEAEGTKNPIEDFLPKKAPDLSPANQQPMAFTSPDIKLDDFLPKKAGSPTPTLQPSTEPKDVRSPTADSYDKGQAGPVGEFGKAFGGHVLDVITGVAKLGAMGYAAAGNTSPLKGTPLEANDPLQKYGEQQIHGVNEGIAGFVGGMRKDPGETLRSGIGGMIGGEGGEELFHHGSFSKIIENPGKFVGDITANTAMLGMPIFGALLKGMSVARKIPGISSFVTGADRAGAALIPKYMMPDAAMSIEAEHAGQLWSKTIHQTQPLTVEASEAIARNPKAAPFIAPETNISTENLALLNKAVDKQWNMQQQMAQQKLPSDFAYNKHGLNVIVDKDGFVKYGHADDFAKLDLATQKNIINVRNAIDTNHQELWERKLISDKEYAEGSLGYTHDTFRVYHNPADWIRTLKNDPAFVSDLKQAKDFMMKNVRDPETLAKLSDSQAEEHVFDLLNHANDVRTGKGMPGTGYSALIQRTEVPEPIRGMLGRMEGKFAPVRVGETLDMQNRILLFDKMASKLANEVGHDGSPLLVQNPSKLGPYSTLRTYDGRPFKALTEEAGQSNPIWGHKWGGADVQVHPDIFDALHTVSNPMHVNAISEAIQAWKFIHVPLNLPSHINHTMGDFIFSGYAGKSVFNPMNWGHYADAGKQIWNMWAHGITTPEIKMALHDGAIRPGFAALEAGSDYAKAMNPLTAPTFGDAAKAILSPIRMARDKIGAAYDMERQWTRFGAWKGLRADGMTSVEASLEVNKYFPTYDTSSAVGNFLRGRANLGPYLPAGVGAFLGGPFTSFQMEAMRIHLTAAREHPWRFFAAQMMPMTLATLGMGASGMSPDSYYDMLKHQPDYQKGKTLIPVPTTSGKPGVADWTHMFPGNEWISEHGKNMILNGPGWSLLDLYHNVDSHTGQPIIHYDRGETVANKGIPWVLQQMLPQAAVQSYRGIKAGLQGTLQRKRDEESPSALAAIPKALAPQFLGARSLDDLGMEARATQAARIHEAVGGMRNIGRDKTLTDEQKESLKNNAREGFKTLQEKN